MAEEKKETGKIQFGPELEGGGRMVARRRGNVVEYGTMKDPEYGRPMAPNSELIRVGARDEDGWHDVTVLYSNRSGPAQVATPQYREGYDRIFGKKQPVGEA